MDVKNKTIREQLEDKEFVILSEFAAKSRFTKGRVSPIEKCPLRTDFQRDRDRIIHSKAFRRLKHKTQVFFSPNDDHYRTRLTHTLEVSQIARTIAKALALNEDLTEAIALGHDLGHTPFGHSGEAILNQTMKNGFKHNEQSVRVATYIENLNLTAETLNGILNHSYAGCETPYTLEGQAVKFSDKIAYIHHDIQDSMRAGIIREADLPSDCIKYFNNNQKKHSSVVAKMVMDIVENSQGQNILKMSDECDFYYKRLRTWMFENVYTNSIAKAEEGKAKNLVKELFIYYTNALEDKFGSSNNDAIEQTATDYISGMTDGYAVMKFKHIFMPEPMIVVPQDNFLLTLAQINGLN
ncbi:MAG: deoxyguanosinetriphosphate triphosphohydrolase [Candidatus Gastranaerophilales bacterium]|nr:deoxyguanosinetriphosphate triphosphohydrolase [Candidatus Gastranaerophilales bacterium]